MKKEAESSESLLEEWLIKEGVIVTLWDLDDTILDTHAVYEKQMKRFSGLLHSRLPQHPEDRLYEQLKKINNSVSKEIPVQRNKFLNIFEEMAKSLSVERHKIVEGLSYLMEIYEIIPEFKEGAVDTLNAFKNTGLPMGLITHAPEDWTAKKLNERGLWKYFTNVLALDTTRPRSPAVWLEVINTLNVSPRNTMVIGDNLEDDIRAAYAIGVKTRVYLPGEWSIYNSGSIPKGTIVVDGGIKSMVDTIVSMT